METRPLNRLEYKFEVELALESGQHELLLIEQRSPSPHFDFLSECNDYPCDTGSAKEVLERDPELQGFDFSSLTPDWTSKQGFYGEQQTMISFPQGFEMLQIAIEANENIASEYVLMILSFPLVSLHTL